MSAAKFVLNRYGAELRVSITEPRTGQTFAFTNASAGSAEWAAVLLHDKLIEEFNARVREIRREAYDAGWKDAKGKKPRRDYFNNCINSKLDGGAA